MDLIEERGEIREKELKEKCEKLYEMIEVKKV
jgi:hypothetical protein